MTFPEVVQVGSAVVSIGAILFSLGTYFQRLRVVERAQARIEEAFQHFLDACAACKKDRIENDSEIHDRVTAVVSDVSFLKGIEEGGRRHGPTSRSPGA